jgi:hypothetical protein
MKIHRQEHKATAIGGIVTRSALEARWAIFFTGIGLEWKYEPTTFRLRNGHNYTPDFKVENLGWIEIKPTLGHLRESVKKIKQFISEPCCTDQVYAICSMQPMFRYGEIILFTKGKIFLPTEIQMCAKITKAVDENAKAIKHEAITSAFHAANAVKLDHMISISDQFRMNREEILARRKRPVPRVEETPTHV